MTISSRPTNDFRPKPPPTSPICTRIWFSGTPVTRENTSRASCGFWLDIHTSSRWSNGSHRATTPRHSIGTVAVAVLHEASASTMVRGAVLQRLTPRRAMRHRHLHHDVAGPVRVHEVLVAGEGGVVVEDRRRAAS